jgi:glycosyltransferase involved in cell wall biosynthesis
VLPLRRGLGLSQAHNIGLTEARGEFVAYLVDHAVAHSGWLDALHRVYGEMPDAWAVGGKVLSAVMSQGRPGSMIATCRG